MTERPPRYRVECTCGHRDEVRSQAVADALADDHADPPLHQTTVVEL